MPSFKLAILYLFSFFFYLDTHTLDKHLQRTFKIQKVGTLYKLIL